MEVAKNSLADSKKEVEKVNQPKTVLNTIKSMEKQFKLALPKHFDSERFTRIAITTIRENPKLAECSQPSLLGALMTAAQLGLEPGMLGQCYLIPFRSKNGIQCTFQLSYKGMIELLRRSGQLSNIYAYAVYENDNFDIEYGLDRNLKHIPNFDNPGNVIGFYAVAKLKDGSTAFEYMTKKQIEKHRDKFTKTKEDGVWKQEFEEMAKKTVIKKLLKYLPVSVEYLEHASKDEKTINAKIKENNDNENYIDELEIVQEIETKQEDKTNE